MEKLFDCCHWGEAWLEDVINILDKDKNLDVLDLIYKSASMISRFSFLDIFLIYFEKNQMNLDKLLHTIDLLIEKSSMTADVFARLVRYKIENFDKENYDFFNYCIRHHINNIEEYLEKNKNSSILNGALTFAIRSNKYKLTKLLLAHYEKNDLQSKESKMALKICIRDAIYNEDDFFLKGKMKYCLSKYSKFNYCEKLECCAFANFDSLFCSKHFLKKKK
jgi:hypothetical protein